MKLRSKNFTAAEVADILEITSRTVMNIENKYEEFGLERALNDDPRPGSPVDFDDRVKSQIVAMAYLDPALAAAKLVRAGS